MKRDRRYIGMLAAAVLAAVMLAGCSSENLAPSEKPTGTGAGGNIITLGVKGVQSAVTRSQHTGSMDFTQLKSTGFGVYGYQGTYDPGSSKPELFTTGANTPVTFETDGTDPTSVLVHPGSWKYAETVNQKIWDTEEKYTFFAYAPYMSAGEGTRGTDAGINTISTGNGDPTIVYTVATDPAQSVDLLWGVRSDDGTANTSSANNGKPWLDCTQTETASTVLFTFCHALCAVGFHAQVMADQTNDTNNLGDVSTLGTIGSATGCKVTLKSITLTPTTSFTKSAVLNLNNDTKSQPKWEGHSASDNISSLVLDNGTTTGHGTIASGLLDPNPSDFSTANPTNYDVMENALYDTEVPGITETANTQTVIAGDNTFMLIPQAVQDYKVTIEYFITYKTASGYHREAKTGTATLSNIELVAGVKYYFNLVFGLTTFKVSVDAVDWAENTESVTIATETGTSASESLARTLSIEH